MRNTAEVLEELGRIFEMMGPDRPVDLAELYADDVVFEDPLHRVEGRAALEAYMERMARGLRWARFDLGEAIVQGDRIALPWTMRYAMKALPGEHALDGLSVFEVRGGRVVGHRDYFDVGAMLYEKIPVLGRVVRWVRASVG